MSEDSRVDLFTGLRRALLSEALTVQRYSYFSEVAEIEGHSDVSAIFAGLVESLSCAAHGHLDWLQGAPDPATDLPIGETGLNLAASVAGERADATSLYPQLAEEAHAHGLADVASWLETMAALKRTHVAKLERALAAMGAG
jgi:rubrerythrin